MTHSEVATRIKAELQEAGASIQSSPRASAGDVIPARCEVIEVRVDELRQLFHAIDPAPFQERDLDPRAEEFIVGWAREASRDKALALDVIVGRGPGRGDEARVLRQAIHVYFEGRAAVVRLRLRELFHRGRISLVIGLAFLAASIVAGDVLASRVAGSPLAVVLSESLLIGGWVAMWRPLEIFLYDWWPIRAEARLLDRLAAMPVRLTYANDASTGTGRPDWPEVGGTRHSQGR